VQIAATTNQIALIDSPRVIAMPPTALAPKTAIPNQINLLSRLFGMPLSPLNIFIYDRSADYFESLSFNSYSDRFKEFMNAAARNDKIAGLVF
jgi:hypothetical protein|tara:strand:- start:356 stop:634 length:279 start_codon:yes stop_codon:yes gene_type:complete